MSVLDQFESVAQNYVRSASIVFDGARGAELFDDHGRRFIDFHSGGGSLSYGHNNARARDAMVQYLAGDHVLQTGDRASVAKRRFVERFVATILKPRGANYRVLFTDPASGTAAEVALRLARRHTKRASVIAFTNASHGMTEGSLSVAAKKPSGYESFDTKSRTVFMPFDGYLGDATDAIAHLRRCLNDPGSGIDQPAAVIVETMQVHGGVNLASTKWLKELSDLCHEFGIILILDETITGCGRTGFYFSFERAGLSPDIILVGNAIAGGLPMSMLLLRPEFDHWRPGEQVGVFQGDNLAFVSASELVAEWNESLQHRIERHARHLEEELSALPARFPGRSLRVRGAGMLWGLDFGARGSAAVVSAWALEHGLLVEPARLRDNVLLVQPPLTIDNAVLEDGLERLKRTVSQFLRHG